MMGHSRAGIDDDLEEGIENIDENENEINEFPNTMQVSRENRMPRQSLLSRQDKMSKTSSYNSPFKHS